MTLETPRLVLREPEDADVELLRDYHRRNAERFAPWDPLPGDNPVVHAGWIATRRAERYGGRPATFFAIDRETSALAGIVSLSAFGAKPASAMLSYSLDGAFEGRGYATEGVGAVLDYAFGDLGLDRISAQYDPANARSEGLLQRLGFRMLARTPVIPGFERLMRAHILAERTRNGA